MAENCLDTCLNLHSRGEEGEVGSIVKNGKQDHTAFVQLSLDDVIVNWKRSSKGQLCKSLFC